MRSLNSFLESPICQVRFAGFEATTPMLQREGWGISAHESMSMRNYGRNIQLLLNHEAANLTMVSTVELFDIEHLMKMSHQFMFSINGLQLGNNRTQFMRIPARDETKFILDAHRFNPIDTMPNYQQIDLGSINLKDFGVFRKLNDTANVFLPEKTVDELMKEILSKQAPTQKEIREKEKTREFMSEHFGGRKPNDKIKLQLVAI